MEGTRDMTCAVEALPLAKEVFWRDVVEGWDGGGGVLCDLEFRHIKIGFYSGSSCS